MANTADTTTKDKSSNRIIIRGTVMWAHLDKPNEMSNKFQLDVCNLTRETVEKLKAGGIEVRKGDENKADKGHFITPKANKPVRIVDAAKVPWPADKRLGNGSIVNVLVRPYEWEFKGKSGIGAGLEAVQVLKHESFEGAMDSFNVEEEFVEKADDINF